MKIYNNYNLKDNCPEKDPNYNNDPCATKRKFGIPCGFDNKANKISDNKIIENIFRG